MTKSQILFSHFDLVSSWLLILFNINDKYCQTLNDNDNLKKEEEENNS